MNITQERVGPAKSIEEQVMDIAEGAGLTIHHIHEDEVSLQNGHRQYWITSTHVIYDDHEDVLNNYINHGRYNQSFPAIAALLKPIKDSQPEQDWYAKYLETKQHYEDLKASYQRQYEELEQSRERVNVLARKEREIEEQLQGCVSLTDHEAIVNKWREDFGKAFDRSQKYKQKSDQYHSWWEAEYIKNVEAGR